MQPYLFTIAGASLLSKFVIAPGAWPDFAGWFWSAIGVGLCAGLLLGEAAASWISARTARRLVLVIAYSGAVAAVVKGIAGVSA